MNKRKLNKVFELIKEKAKLDYAITNTDDYGDCPSCVNAELSSRFGLESKGIFAKHWTRGMNDSGPWKNIEGVYIAHDLTSEQGKIIIQTFKEEGYNITPEEYIPSKCFCISERKEI